jgi:hypothetical protein
MAIILLSREGPIIATTRTASRKYGKDSNKSVNVIVIASVGPLKYPESNPVGTPITIPIHTAISAATSVKRAPARILERIHLPISSVPNGYLNDDGEKVLPRFILIGSWGAMEEPNIARKIMIPIINVEAFVIQFCAKTSQNGLARILSSLSRNPTTLHLLML